MSTEPMFHRYIGIDYSGAQTPTSSLKGLRVYMAIDKAWPAEVPPPPSPRKYWTRKELAHWLIDVLSGDIPTIVGIDHSFSFPIRYFEVHHIEPNWDVFLDDFQRYWPTDNDYMYVCFIQDGLHGDGDARSGNSRWRRIVEVRAGAKSVFHFGVPGSVAHSTHAGLPWLRYIRRQLGTHIHFWPFDGWDMPQGKSVIVEVYPSIWSRDYPRQGRTPDQHDAFTATVWMRNADREGRLPGFFHPELLQQEKATAIVEGWILGVM